MHWACRSATAGRWTRSAGHAVFLSDSNLRPHSS
nr:MAG TPA: hypothetical protein [Caudoviricetes sp.]